MDGIYRDAMPDVFATCDFEPWDLIIKIPLNDEGSNDVDKDTNKSLR